MSVLDEFFNLKIGDVVDHIGVSVLFMDNSIPQPCFIIVGRLLDECDGGIQRKYAVRQCGKWQGLDGLTAIGVATGTVVVGEFELVRREKS